MAFTNVLPPSATLEKPRPSVFAIAVVFGGTSGLTISSLLGVTGGGGFLLGTFVVFIALSSAVLISRARSEQHVESEQLRKLVFLATQLSADISERLPVKMMEIVRSQEHYVTDKEFVRQMEILDSKLQEAQHASQQLHEYKTRPTASAAERTAEIIAVSAAVLTALQLVMQLVRDLYDYKNHN